jgi:uncharacterized membrane protein
MKNLFQNLLKPMASAITMIALVATLFFSQATPAEAASYGGRMGGGSFRSAPSRSYSAPRSSGGNYGGGYNRGYGGGSGFFFMPSPWMFFAGGGMGGGLFSLMLFVVVAGAAVQAFQRYQGDNGLEFGGNTSTVSVGKVQVGLLANAKSLQEDLNRIAASANTNSSAGLAKVLQETTLSLMRHPEYWAYAGGEVKQSSMLAAETEFNRMALSERSKFLGESVSNVAGQINSNDRAITVSPGGALSEQSSEYIVVTLIVGAEGKLELPAINNAVDLRRALSLLGAVGSDRLLSLEVLWQPGSTDGVLTSDDMIEYYPKLKLV